MKKLDIKIYLLGLLILSCLHFVFALRTHSYFSVDDFAILGYFKNHTVLQMIPDFLIHGDIFNFRRLVGFIAFGALYEIFGINSIAFDASMLITNTINLFILFYIVKKLTNNNFGSFFVALIFNKNYLFYYSNIHEHLLATFCLLTIFFFLHYPKKFYLYLTTFVLALFTKETAVTVPLVLLAISLFYKVERKKIYYLLVVAFLYGLYASYFFISNKVLTPNFSYTVATRISDLFNGFVYYINYKVVILCLLLSVVFKKYKYLPLFAVVLVTLIPASLLVNRREMYYLYMPFSYLMLYVSLFLPKISVKSLYIYIIIFFVFGGRSILPMIAWQEFPNWQLDSINKVLDKAEQNDFNFENMTLERDAKLMIESNTVDLFLKSRK